MNNNLVSIIGVLSRESALTYIPARVVTICNAINPYKAESFIKNICVIKGYTEGYKNCPLRVGGNTWLMDL